MVSLHHTSQTNMIPLTRYLVTTLILTSVLPLFAANPDGTPGGAAVLENDLIKVEISESGGRILSFQDKLRGTQEAKIHPHVGGLNEIRARSLGVDDVRAQYALSEKDLPGGGRQVTAVLKAAPSRKGDEDPAAQAGALVKTYTLRPDSSAVDVTLTVTNPGDEEIAFFPWIRHLLLQSEAGVFPDQSFMSPYGVFSSEKPTPWERKEISHKSVHHIPADGWTSRVTSPENKEGNTLFTVFRPQDVFRFYNWTKPKEDFATQEIIAAPLFLQPGESKSVDYVIGLAPAVEKVAFASPELVVGVSPQASWIPAGTEKLDLAFAATQKISMVEVEAKVRDLRNPDAPAQTKKISLGDLTPKKAVKAELPVTLADGGRYQLELTFTSNGKPFEPASALGVKGGAVIPLLVGDQPEPQIVFAPKTTGSDGLRKVTGRERQARKIGQGDGIEFFATSPSERVFLEDRFAATEEGPAMLRAAAGEYESLQLVAQRKDGQAVKLRVKAGALEGPDGAKIEPEQPRRFLYTHTETPSQYNALFPVGAYPEALLPSEIIEADAGHNAPVFVTYQVPENATPGLYKGVVTVVPDGGATVQIPVEFQVWNYAIPRRSPYMQFASSLKGQTVPGAVDADGKPLSKDDQLRLIEDMHLKYRLTPCDGSVAQLLLSGNREAFEARMQEFVDAGATKIYLGSIPRLLERHGEKLPETEAYLKSKGWNDYFYVRPGFDEASQDLVPQIAEVCRQWKAVSTIPIMETYYHDQQAEGLFGLLDIWSRNFPSPPWQEEREKAGDRFWKVNAFPGHLEPEPWDRGRQRYVELWDNHFTGSYVWTAKDWRKTTDFEKDPWNDHGVGNLSAVLMWPHETGILSTIRLEAMRDGLEDATALWMLRDKVKALEGISPADPAQARALQEARELCKAGPLAPKIKSAQDMDALRNQVGDLLSTLNTLQP